MMLSLLMLQHRIGFFGHEGGFWAFLGFLFMVVIVAILFKLMKLILPALGVGEPWATVCFWVGVLLCVFFFANYAFGGWF